MKCQLTFRLCAAGHSVDGGDGPGETKPLSLQLALLPSGALLEDLDHSILLQELSVKCSDPKHVHIDFNELTNPKTPIIKLVSNKNIEGCVPVLHLLMSVTRQRQVFIETAVW